MSPTTFAAALTQAEAQARSTLDVALHERLSAAVSLVRAGRVFQDSAGEWQVDSSSQEGLVYDVNGTCSCRDIHYNKPPKGLCKHRLAMFLSQRVLTLMQQAPGSDDDVNTQPAPEVVSVDTNNLPLPEAGASCNVRVLIAGHEVQWTLRGHAEAEVFERLGALLRRSDVKPVPKPASRPSNWKRGNQGR